MSESKTCWLSPVLREDASAQPPWLPLHLMKVSILLPAANASAPTSIDPSPLAYHAASAAPHSSELQTTRSLEPSTSAGSLRTVPLHAPARHHIYNLGVHSAQTLVHLSPPPAPTTQMPVIWSTHAIHTTRSASLQQPGSVHGFLPPAQPPSVEKLTTQPPPQSSTLLPY